MPCASLSALSSQISALSSQLSALSSQLSALSAALCLLALTAVAEAQTVITPTNTTSFAGNAVGVAVSTSGIVASTSGVNFNFNINLSVGSPAHYTNSSNVVDTGLAPDGLRRIESYNNGGFALIRISDSFTVGNGTIPSGVLWGISNSFLVGSSEYVWVGYTDVSATKSVVLYNFATSTFGGASFTFTTSQTPSGLGNYSLVGGNTIADQRLLVSFSNSSIAQFSSNGTNEANYIWGGGGPLRDVSVLTNGTTSATLYGVSLYDGVQSDIGSAPFTIAAIPEPSTYAALAGIAALAMAAIRRRRRE